MNPYLAITQPQQLSAHCQSGFFIPQTPQSQHQCSQIQDIVVCAEGFPQPSQPRHVLVKKLWWHEVRAAWCVRQGPLQPATTHLLSFCFSIPQHALPFQPHWTLFIHTNVTFFPPVTYKDFLVRLLIPNLQSVFVFFFLFPQPLDGFKLSCGLQWHQDTYLLCWLIKGGIFLTTIGTALGVFKKKISWVNPRKTILMRW